MQSVRDVKQKWILSVVTIARYLFMVLAAIGLGTWLFNVEIRYFSEQLSNSYFRAYLIFEALYWGLKYKLLLDETRGKK